jgi:ABC-type transport system substrate-binding protein
MVEAGYPDGRDAVTGKPLVLNYDFNRVVTPEFKAENDWLAKQFAKLGVQLEVRATDYNQFQEKLQKGKHQIYWWGWFADYPDAENFLFLLYGPNAKSLHQGENSSNYQSAEFDRRFKALIRLDDGPEKQRLMDEMLAIVREDAPWAFGYFPWVGYAYQSWLHNGKPTIMIRDLARYYRIDPASRQAKLEAWNAPVRWPLLLGLFALLILVALAWRSARAQALRTARKAAA